MADVFVTGASGFLGGALLRALHGRGDDVRALARSPRAVATVVERGATPIYGDLASEDRLVDAMDGCSLAFHVAGVNSHCPADPAELLAANVGGTERVVRAAARAGVRRLVLTSSAATLGERAGTVGREDSPHRGRYLSAYERSKREAERAAFALAEASGLELVALLPSSIQGPGRATGNGKLVLDYLDGRLPVFVDAALSIVDVDDCAAGHVLAADAGRPGARYVLHGATLESREALALLARVGGVSHPVRMLPPRLVRLAALAAEGAGRLRGRPATLCRARVATILHGHRYDGSLAERELGLAYRPAEETFARIVAWARAAGLVGAPGARRDAKTRGGNVAFAPRGEDPTMVDDPREPDEAPLEPGRAGESDEPHDGDTIPALPSKNKDTALGDTDQHSTEDA